jgi:hypothetical protein
MLDKRFIALAAIGLAAVTGCSGGHAGTSAAGLSADGAPGGSAGASTSHHSGAGSIGTSASSSSNKGQPQAAAGAPANGNAAPQRGSAASPKPTATEVPLNASLSATCVTAGQTLTLTLHAEPNMRVVFDTRYPDGKDGQVHGGMDAHGWTTANGTYTSTWTVAPGTPPGAADVEAAAVGYNYHTGHQRLPFTVALTCP